MYKKETQRKGKLWEYGGFWWFTSWSLLIYVADKHIYVVCESFWSENFVLLTTFNEVFTWIPLISKVPVKINTMTSWVGIYPSVLSPKSVLKPIIQCSIMFTLFSVCKMNEYVSIKNEALLEYCVQKKSAKFQGYIKCILCIGSIFFCFFFVSFKKKFWFVKSSKKIIMH